jgi:hypothetical protein
MINKKETKMSLAIVGMALLATVITTSTPIPALAMGHWNPDEDYAPNTGFADLTRSPPPLVQGAFADHGQKIMLTSKDSQTITNPSIPQPTTLTTTTSTPVTYIAEEICNDGIDNDSDTLIDFSDAQCNPLQSQQQPVVQQEQTMASTPEICDDDLDNDFDGSVDSRDEECNSIITSSFPPPIQEQTVTDEQIGGEDDGDKEQQSNEDVSEESGEKDDGDGEDNKEDDNNDDKNEDGDEEQQSNGEDNDDDDDKEDE